MSHVALLRAVVDHLLDDSSLGLDRENCAITHDGQPFPIAGDLFVAVWPGYWRDQGSNGESLHEGYGGNVTVSLRCAHVPRDRIGVEVLAKASIGLLAICEKVRASIHMDPSNLIDGGVQKSSVMMRANQIIGAAANGFVVPLQFQDGGRAEQKSGSWWSAKGEPMAGLAQTVTFGGAERVQPIDGPMT
ncbi:MAG TPA: hypothetical protein PJ982_14680 [Lacipirellulaceae bacterium]|nr:hypothetical protein [Lacipirellulaceae bacterium]